IKQVNRLLGHMIVIPGILAGESFGAEVLEQYEERIEESGGVEKNHRLVMELQLAERENLEHFLQRAEAAGKNAKGVRAKLHRRLALAHITRDDQFIGQ